MADCSKNTLCSTSYWQDVTMDFGDGEEVQFNLETPVYEKVIKGDPKTIALLRENYLEMKRTEVDFDDNNNKIDKSTPLKQSTSAKATTVADKDNSTELQAKFWTEAESALLVNIRIENNELFKSAKSHKKLWDDIAKEMNAKTQLNYTGDQCSNKWKALKRSYMETIDHNNKTGNNPKECKFYNEFNMLFGNKDCTKPAFIIDSSELQPSDDSGEPIPKRRNLHNSSINSVESGQGDEDSDNGDTNENVTAKPQGRRLRKAGKSGTIKWLEKYTEKQEQLQNEKRADSQRRHEEKMQRFDRLLDILDK